MIFGFDFDNTIVNYDIIFKNIYLKKNNFIYKNLDSKTKIKNFLLKKKKLRDWKILQSKVYSSHIFDAKVNHEIFKLMKYLDNKRIKFYIVSHKTLHPYIGDKINLHKISKSWLKKKIFNKKNNFSREYRSYFEKTEKKKINKINDLEITHFVDDLDQILNRLPKKIVGIKFNKLFTLKKIKKKYF